MKFSITRKRSVRSDVACAMHKTAIKIQYPRWIDWLIVACVINMWPETSRVVQQIAISLIAQL